MPVGAPVLPMLLKPPRDGKLSVRIIFGPLDTAVLLMPVKPPRGMFFKVIMLGPWLRAGGGAFAAVLFWVGLDALVIPLSTVAISSFTAAMERWRLEGLCE